MKYVILTLLILLPLPYASTMPVWQWFWVVIIGLVAGIEVIRLGLVKNTSIPFSISLLQFIMFLFIIWSLLQPFVINNTVIDMTSAVALVVGPNILGGSAAKASLLFLAHTIFFIVVYRYCICQEETVGMVRSFGLIVSVYVMLGFFLLFSGYDNHPWFEAWSDKGALSSTFVNRNNFSAFLGLGLQCLIAYAYFQSQTNAQSHINCVESRVTSAVLFLINNCWVYSLIFIGVSGLLLTNSRGGVVSVAIAIAAFVILARSQKIKKGNALKRWTGYGLFTIFFVSVFSLSGDMLSIRMLTADSLNVRFNILPSLLEMIGDRPISGFGLGSFEDVFRIYRDHNVSLNIIRAHNDYLELAATAGFLGFLAIMIGVFFVLFDQLRSLKSSIKERCLVVLGSTSTIQLGLHAIVDFPFQILPISFLWVAIMAVSLSVVKKSGTITI